MRIKETLIRQISLLPKHLLPIRLAHTFTDEQGFEYDTLSCLKYESVGIDGIFLTDSANGSNNPTYLCLESLAPSRLWDILSEARSKIISILASTASMECENDPARENLCETLGNLLGIIKADEELKRQYPDPLAAAKTYIFERLLSMPLTRPVDWPHDVFVRFDYEDRNAPLGQMFPYFVEVDTFQGMTIERIEQIDAIAILSKDEDKQEVLIGLLDEHFDEAQYSTLAEAKVTPRGIEITSSHYQHLTESAYYALEDWLNCLSR